MIKYQRMENALNDFADETPTVTLARSEWSEGEIQWSERARTLATARALTDERDRANLAAWNASRKSA